MSIEFTGFAVFDLETTVIAVSRHHRVIEIGVVRLDEDFEIVEEWETLINPERDIGAGDIHGLTASDLRNAPTFAELIADIWHRFEGAIPVAHNFSFDRRFMIAEFSRAGVDIGEFNGLCTMRLVGDCCIAVGARRLSDICWQMSLPVLDCHSAGNDARMCADILKIVAKELDPLAYASPVSCPELWRRRATPLGITRRKARELPIESPLQILAERLNGATVGEVAEIPNANEYLLILDRILEDRIVEQVEADELMSFAHDCAIRPDQMGPLHERYLTNLVALALSDGIVTEDERRDLDRVAGLLAIKAGFIQRLLDAPLTTDSFLAENLAGKRVCFTGELRCVLNGERVTREVAEATAVAAGLEVAPRVTKKVDILVVADPDTASAKARKAREYGIRIMAERPFWQRLGVAVD